MEFWRVFNWNPAAEDPDTNGHPLFTWPHQGAGRVDDPEHDYKVLYAGDSPEGAAAEAFGLYLNWTPDIFDVPFAAPPGTVKVLARFEGDPPILDLDDPYALQQRGLRPSHVVSKERDVTQAWARDIYDDGDYQGASWWSYYDPRWASFGLWDLDGMAVAGEPEILSIDHDAVVGAAATIMRALSSRRLAAP